MHEHASFGSLLIVKQMYNQNEAVSQGSFIRKMFFLHEPRSRCDSPEAMARPPDRWSSLELSDDDEDDAGAKVARRKACCCGLAVLTWGLLR